MSNISNTHNVTPFVSGTSKPLHGQRLIKVGFKKTDKIPNPLPSVCVSVPFHSADMVSPENLQQLLPYIGTMLENAQDGIVRTLYESSNGVKNTIHDDEIGFSAILGYLENEKSGGKLSAEKVAKWFTEQIEENLIVVFADKLGFTSDDLTENQLAVINKHIAGNRDLLCSLTGHKVILQENQINGLRRVLELAVDRDNVWSQLSSKLNDQSAKSADLMMLLD